MADIRIKDLATTAASTASDDFVAVDGSANGTRKLNAFSPTFGGNLTVSGTGGSASTISTIGTGTNAEQNSLLVDATTSGTPAAGYGPSIRFTRKGNDGGSSSTSGAIKSVAIAGTGGNQYNADIIIAPRLGGSLVDALTVKTDGGATLAGNLTVSGTGDNSLVGPISWGTTVPANAVLLYKTGNTKYGNGLSSGSLNNFVPAGGNKHSWGYMSTSDGTTYTELMSLVANTGLLTLAGNLTVSGTGTHTFGGTLAVGNGTDTGNATMGVNGSTNVSNIYLARSDYSWGINNESDFRIYFKSGRTTAPATGGTKLFEIKNTSGNVLIGGGADGGQKLQVSGTAYVSGDLTVGAKTGAQSTPDKLQMSSGYPNTSTPTNQQLKISLGYVSATQNYGFTTDNLARIWYHAGDTVGPTGGHVFATGGIAALTLDSSQRCILAGALRLNNAYVSGAPTATGYVTLQDSAGNTYKVLVGT